jgi:hypothetical protein
MQEVFRDECLLVAGREMAVAGRPPNMAKTSFTPVGS